MMISNNCTMLLNSKYSENTEKETQKLAKETNSYLKQLVHLGGETPTEKVAVLFIMFLFVKSLVCTKKTIITGPVVNSSLWSCISAVTKEIFINHDQ